MTTTISLPYEQWESFADATYSADMFSEGPSTEDGKPCSARTQTVEGMLLTSSGIYYHGCKGHASAWRLVPAKMWSGPSTPVVHDEAAIKEGWRIRGNKVGVQVNLKGHLHVIAEEVRVTPGFPSSRARLTEAEAKAYFAHGESQYFITHNFNFVRWEMIGGFPVAVGLDDDEEKETGLLYYRKDKGISRIWSKDLQELYALADSAPAPRQSAALDAGAQMSLF